MEKRKRLVLNKRGEILTAIILFIAIITAAADCKSLTAFIISKVIAIINLLLFAKLLTYYKD